jgi:hypothetical protein
MIIDLLYFWKVGKYTHTHTYTEKTMLILNMFIYKTIYEKKNEKKSSRYHCCSNVWNNEIQMHFQSNYLTFWFKKFHRCVNLGKIFKNEHYLFSFGQSMKNIIMVKVGYFCMGQRMMWNNVVNLSHVLYQQVEFCKLYN